MRTSQAGAVLMLCAAGLSACTDGPVAPRRDGLPPSASVASCGGYQQAASTVRLDAFGSLPVITVTATFPGLPWNVIQSMQFPLGAGGEGARCLNDANVTYGVGSSVEEAPDYVPPPAGVDIDFWNSLSPREQHVLVAVAEEYRRLYPGRYPGIGAVINNVFREQILRAKTDSKIRANDFFGTAAESEQFGAAIYGCELYRSFAQDPNWITSNSDALRLSIDLVTAFAESQFAYSPLRGLQFGRNGVFGAATAAAYFGPLDCGALAFAELNQGHVIVTDPYATPAAPGGGGGGGGTPPGQSPSGSLPPGWYDF